MAPMDWDWRLEGCDLHHCGGEGDECTNGKLFPSAASARSRILEPTRCRRVVHPLGEFGRNGRDEVQSKEEDCKDSLVVRIVGRDGV